MLIFGTSKMNDLNTYEEFIAATQVRLGISDSYINQRQFSLQQEPDQLSLIGLDVYGRRQWVAAHVISPLKRLLFEASKEGVAIGLISAFRSVSYQILLIEKKLHSGVPIDVILSMNAPPGYSEHHSGEAVDFVDLETHSRTTLNKSFEGTATFNWLQLSASQHGFFMSFPENNPYGIVYEPWHWRFKS